jgi:[ribosomal protein S18]-alanine N-acetyltransferase
MAHIPAPLSSNDSLRRVAPINDGGNRDNAADAAEKHMIVPLRPDDLNRIWLVTETHFTVRLLRQHLDRYPHLGWMYHESGDYIVGSYWKDRLAIGQIMESSPCTQRAELVQRLLFSYRETGSDLVVLSDHEVAQALPLYQDLGFVVLEDVVCYDRSNTTVGAIERRMDVRPLRDEDVPALVKLEEATFPWLWWETPTTFRLTNQRPDTWVLVAYLGDALVGYLILAVRGTWGHLNRIGVHPAYHGLGLGRELLTVAIEEMARRGAHTLGLNTQSTNARSQRLYEGFGFQRTGETFKIYGKWLDEKKGKE